MPSTVLITGASSGIGEALAKKFAKDAQHLILVARRLDRLETIKKAIESDYSDITISLWPMDVQNQQAITDKLSELNTSIDLLINNAGLALGLESAQQAKLDDWDTMVDTNIKGLMYFTRLVLPSMVASGQGHIINLGSVAASWPYPGGNVYGASKAFVQQFGRNLRTDLHGTGVRITTIEPGMVHTDFSKVRFRGDEGAAEKVYQGAHPLTASDIADIIHWVAHTPPHININSLEVMPTGQSWAPFRFVRDSD